MIDGRSVGADGQDDRWPLVERYFAAALDTPAEERERVLAAECTDDAVRAEVRRLLARHDALTSADRETDAFLTSLDAGHALRLLDGADAHEPARIGRYEVIRTLGRGATGAVYLAHDPTLHRHVAVKVLSAALSGDRGATRRFEQEARAASALDHPRVVTLHEIGRAEDGRLFISMAYHAGATLRERIAGGPLPVDEAVRIAAEVAEGLAAAHAKGIVHRDIKPENILLTAQGARIVDFGIAKIAGQALTRTGAALGTAAYMSPEQTFGADVDGRTDLWSVGVVLYEMLTGMRPFRSEGGEALVYAVRHDVPAAVEHCRPEVPPAIADVVRRCLEKDRADRFGSAVELVAALGGRSSEPPRPRRAGRRRPAAVMAAGVAAVALIAFVAAGRREPAAPLGGATSARPSSRRRPGARRRSRSSRSSRRGVRTGATSRKG